MDSMGYNIWGKTMEKSSDEKLEICCRFMGDFSEKHLTHGDLDGISFFWGGVGFLIETVNDWRVTYGNAHFNSIVIVEILVSSQYHYDIWMTMSYSWSELLTESS